MPAPSGAAETASQAPARGEAGTPPAAVAGEAQGADGAHRLEWRWRRFGVVDYVATAAVTAAYLYMEFGVDPPDEPNWRGGILFDDAVRRAVVADSRGARNGWNVASDVLALIPQGMMVIDSLFVPLLSDDWNTDVAWHLSVIAVQSEALTGFLSRVGHHGIGRERPDVAPCRQDPSYSVGCFRGTTAGFPGGHAAGAFVGAGVVCAHHLHLPLYGGGAWDVAACVSNLAVATAAGYSRMAADRHYLSDTLTGMAIGIGAGFILPSLVHYRGGPAASGAAGGLRWAIVPGVADALGLGMYGWF